MDTAAGDDGGASTFVRAPAVAKVKEQPPDFEDVPDPVVPPQARAAAVVAAATIAAATADEGDDTEEESSSDEPALAVDAAVPSGRAARRKPPAGGAHRRLLPLLPGLVAAGEDAVMIARNRGAPLTVNQAVAAGDARDARKYDK